MQIKNILIYAELNDSNVNPVFFELLTKAKELITDEKSKISCLLLGCNTGAPLEELKSSGIDEIYLLEDERLTIYNIDYYCAGISSAVSKIDPDIILFGATSIGEELAPTMGLRLKTGVAAHCMDVKMNDDGKLAQLVPAFGGKVVGEIFTPNSKPQIISIKPGILSSIPQQANKNCEITILDASILEDVSSNIEPVKIMLEPSQGIGIEKADFIVCAGYGIAKSDIKEELDELAKLLNGAVGYTRPAIDAGMAHNESNMIGTSGKSVRPKVYLGLGVSGSTHHVCGMKESDIIVSVNTDPNSEIFNISDYKAVGDGTSVVKELIKLISQ